ncbi:YfhO family protein [Bacillus spizizenii]|uniref:YfhO family protein n=1 Tax=Bacillus spizizenii TaxID=96241 RepID=UPI0005EDA5AF|nr:YfhO family protein [Bacillus spizizenii]MDU7576155.1 YfhO family protein [Bacillus subtilis]MCY7810868.1 YfhO family protein [Bacillus spizizenii]MCY7825439.1 YfhO family protein [Bacillus spizizenii]MCY7854529.1 YfhO family protein [Bacillus spizizenii]MCY7882275.1 YfhO family protein [Bacillus spizizenii]
MKRKYVMIYAASLLVSVLAHAFFVKEWADDRYMTGPGDGLAQMIVFKKLLYDQYTHGNFFYNYSFGLGGGTFSQLGYYFSASFLFLAVSVAVWLLQAVQLIGEADTLFWAESAVFISIFKLSLIMFTAAAVFHYLLKHRAASFTGAVLYGASIIYFRHEAYWEFFTDTMIWLPLLVLGAEKIIRERRPAWFIIACSLTLINNFYFAYINLIFIGIYVLFRWLIRLEKHEEKRWIQCRTFLVSGLISFGISAVVFVPVVYGYLNNLRPPYSQKIEWLNFDDNILFSSRIIIVPAAFLLFLFLVSFYKNRVFRLFAGLSLLFILFHFSPYAASVFNGFSAPQNRFEYVLAFTIAGAAAAGLSQLSELKWKELLPAIAVVLLLYLYHIQRYKLDIWKPANESILLLLLLTIAALFAAAFAKKRAKVAVYGVIILSSLFVANTYQKYALSEGGGLDSVTKAYLTGEEYKGQESSELIRRLQKEDDDSLMRIDWMNGVRNNTPIIYGFNGFSAYSSILNKHLLTFYWNDLGIDMGRESVSRYASLGDRANLYSLLYGKYYMTEKTNEASVPYGFKKHLESEHYAVYENQYMLPFIKTADAIYSESELDKLPALAKEQAMLKGIVLANPSGKTEQTPKLANLIPKSDTIAKHAQYQNGLLTVTGENGGELIITPKQASSSPGDYYVSFYLKSKAKDKGFTLRVNDYVTTRKSNQSIYKTGVNDITVRVPKSDHISIKLPKGTYELKNIALYEENYQTLKSAVLQNKTDKEDNLKWDKNKLTFAYRLPKNQYIMLPIPYEKGWELKINGKTQTIEKADYAFIAFKAQKGDNHIELAYYPPYFKISALISLVSLLLAVLYIRRKKARL